MSDTLNRAARLKQRLSNFSWEREKRNDILVMRLVPFEKYCVFIKVRIGGNKPTWRD